VILVALLGAVLMPASAQQTFPPEAVPSDFREDAVFAARLRALTLPSSQPAAGQYATGRQVLDRLTQQLPSGQSKFSWELRIARGAGNMFSSPDGTIFVDEDLAQLLGARSGFWAAALSHEMAHVVRRDWARRHLFQKSLQESVSAQVVVGAGGSSAGSWMAPGASADRFAAFCRSLELEADAQGLALMARAGFHPAFMPALYHILQAQPLQLDPTLQDFSHPLWDERDDGLHSHFAAAGKEFDRLWPDLNASPGGNPPIVVYLRPPSARRALTGEQEVLVPLHCDNLYGSVEVVLRLTEPGSGFVRELRQYTGCTSNRTLVTFNLATPDLPQGRALQTTISILDDRSTLLSGRVALDPIR
jgi:hypothetical protein